MWSAAPPWSFFTTGFATAWLAIGAIVGTVDIFKPPWDAGSRSGHWPRRGPSSSSPRTWAARRISSCR